MMPGTTHRINLRIGKSHVNLHHPIKTQNKANKVVDTKEQTLLVGPWIGEFGWELFCWQGYIRKIATKYKKVIVMSRKGHDFLYTDFCDEFISFNPSKGLSSDSWMCNGLNDGIIIKEINKHKFDVRLPATNIGFLIDGNGQIRAGEKYNKQKFVKYVSNTIDKSVDILIHPRNKSIGNIRNWNKKNWEDLIEKLKTKYSIGIIGTDESFSFNGVEDFRNISVEDSVSLMNRCKLIVGPSSGPMHLASLSGTPHLVWSSSHNKNRYIDAWNPFKTQVYFYDLEGWNPKPVNIYNKIIKILN